MTIAPTSTELALLATVLADPGDDTPRLVLADWLSENGEDDYGTFIRVQCELAKNAGCGRCTDCHGYLSRVNPQCPRFALLRRERALWEAHSRDWFAGITHRLSIDPHDSREPLLIVSRGFVSAVTCSWSQWHGAPCTRTDCFNEAGDGPDPECMRCNGRGLLPGTSIASQLVRLSDPCEECRGLYTTLNVRGPVEACPHCTAGRVPHAVQPGMQPITACRLTDDTLPLDSRFVLAQAVGGGGQDRSEWTHPGYPGIVFTLLRITRPAAAR